MDATDAAHGERALPPSPAPLVLEFCGQRVAIERSPFTIGRDADLVIDDNHYLHRRLVRLTACDGQWVLTNTGARLTVGVTDPHGFVEARIAPGGSVPLVAETTIVRFAAGSTTYDFCLHLAGPPLRVPRSGTDHHTGDHGGDATGGQVAMTPDQLRLVLALAEPRLADWAGYAAPIPSSAEAARRLGWTLTRFNRKLDNVCQKLAAQGVRGLHGRPGRLASDRRARLVEHAITTRLVTRDDVGLLDAATTARDGR